MIILKETRFIETLDREANLYIGLPDAYEKTQLSYPVLYMHDGHNLFYQDDSYSGEIWAVDQCFKDHPELSEVIVVALSCSNKNNGRGRFSEYSIFDITLGAAFGTRAIPGKGRTYLEYLVNELKPEIDQRFRTLSDQPNTAMMGSSMGGVISNQAAILYPQIYGRVACLSSAFYVSLDEILKLNETADFTQIVKFYMDTGDNESGLGSSTDYLESNLKVSEILKTKLSNDKFQFKIIEGGIHHERDWRNRLPSVLSYLFKS